MGSTGSAQVMEHAGSTGPAQVMEHMEGAHLGRRPIMLWVNREAFCSVGMSLNRTKLYYCMKTLGGRLLYTGEIELDGRAEGIRLLALMEQAVTTCLLKTGMEEDDLLAIGVASRGTVNEKKGSVIYSPDKGEEIEVSAYLRERHDCTILVENDVIADLKDQYTDFNGINRNLVYLYLSDGVGGCVISNGQVIDGETSMAGKFAHILVETDGRVCQCGQRGHLEAYASKMAMEEAYLAVSKRKLSLKEICARAEAGEPAAEAVLWNAVEKLAVGINQIFVMVNPGTLVLYGELFENSANVLKRLKERTMELAYTREIADVRWLLREKKNVRIQESVARLAVERALGII